MKKTITTLCLLLLATLSYAVKADRTPFTFTQKDGSQVTVRAFGDENFHYLATLDGVLVKRQGKDVFIAEVLEDGSLRATGILAHDKGQRIDKELQAIKRQDKTKFFSIAKEKEKQRIMQREPVQNKWSFPSFGSPKAVVILAQFQDVKFTLSNLTSAFNQFLNGDGAMQDYGNHDTRLSGSICQYLMAMSGGKFTPQFDIYGTVTLDHEMAYYGAGKDNMSRFIPEVCDKADGMVDFSQYDINQDGVVDLVYIVYAGYGENMAGNSEDCIWPKSGVYNAGNYDGKVIGRYGVNNELNGVEGQQTDWITGSGLFLHEFSHCMGLPDLYTTTAATEECQAADNQEMEYWSIMDSGCYIYNGYAPCAYTAWEREALNWIDIETLQDKGTKTLVPLDSQGGNAYRILNENNSNEYFILENVQQTDWNRKIKGHGMLVTHVDFDRDIFSLVTSNGNTVNNVLGHPRMTVLAADGLLMNQQNATDGAHFYAQLAGDPFPGTSVVTSLTDETDVKPLVYAGNSLGKPVLNIAEDEATGAITFDYLEATPTGINAIQADNSGSSSVGGRSNGGGIFTLSGTEINGKPQRKGIYIANGRKIVVR